MINYQGITVVGRRTFHSCRDLKFQTQYHAAFVFSVPCMVVQYVHNALEDAFMQLRQHKKRKQLQLIMQIDLKTLSACKHRTFDIFIRDSLQHNMREPAGKR